MTGREGKLIVLEGVDDIVLTALSEQLYRWLRGQGVAVEQTREPTHGPVGAQIRLVQQGRLRLDPASLALFWVADRMDHLEREGGVLSWLADGRHVVCVHYLLFSYAHQWDQVDRGWLRQINAYFRPPDLVLFIDTPGASPLRGVAERVVPKCRVDTICACAPEAERLRQSYLEVIESLRSEAQLPIEIIGGYGTLDEVYRACQCQVEDLLDP